MQSKKHTNEARSVITERKMLTDDEKKIIKNKIAELGYADGYGISHRAKRKLYPGLYLFISSGGNGRDTLLTVKKLLERKLIPEEMKKVAFLVADCALNELNAAETAGLLTHDETFRIPSTKELDLIKPDVLEGTSRGKWVDNRLYAACTADGTADNGFGETGAGAWRQPGRVRFCTSASGLYERRISDKLNTLITENRGCMSENQPIQIFFLASVAGGTGSGTLFDMAVLTRHVVQVRGWYARLNAYILSPSACDMGPGAKKDVNVNAYAAMKEIDYFMNLTNRSETYSFDYGDIHIEINGKNIFDFCTLVDGKGKDTGDLPPQTVRNGIANSIFSLITVQNTTGEENSLLFGDSSFLANIPQAKRTLLSGKTLTDDWFPRVANYDYNVIGYSAMKLPLEIIKVMVAYEMFKKLHNDFKNAGEPTDDSARSFLDKCGASMKSMCDSGRKQCDKALENIESNAKEVLSLKGPSYLVNLLYKAAAIAVKRSEEAHDESKKLRHLPSTREGYQRAENRFPDISKKCLELNNGYYEALKAVLGAFSKIVSDDYGIVTKLEEYKTQFDAHKTLTWCPVEFPSVYNDANNNGIIQYIRETYYNHIGDIAKDFMQAVVNEIGKAANQLINISGTGTNFNPQAFLSNFVQDKFGNAIDESIEDLIVKAFNPENPHAKTMTTDAHNNPVRTEEARNAVTAILKRLKTEAVALAGIIDDPAKSGLDAFPSRILITVPENCPNLIKEIRRQCPVIFTDVNNSDEMVVSSTAADEITMQRMYSAVPAFRFSWVHTSDASYLKQCSDAGLHLEQKQFSTRDEDDKDEVLLHNWMYLPPLYNEARWTPAERARHKTELDLLKAAEGDFNTAIALEICREKLIAPEVTAINHDGGDAVHNAEVPERPKAVNIKLYEIYKVARNNRGALRINEIETFINGLTFADIEDPDTHKCLTLKDFVDRLTTRGLLRNLDIARGNYCFNTPSAECPEDFFEKCAYKTLRYRMQDWMELRKTIPLIQALKEKVDEFREQWRINKEQREKLEAARKRQKARIDTFRYILCSGETDNNEFIIFKKEEIEWQICTDHSNAEWITLCTLPFKPYAAEFCEYYAFEAFCKLDEEKYQAIDTRLHELWEQNPSLFNSTVDRVAEFQTSCKALHDNRRGSVSEKFTIEIKGSVTAGERRIRYPMADPHFCDGDDAEVKRDIRETYAMLS